MTVPTKSNDLSDLLCLLLLWSFFSSAKCQIVPQYTCGWFTQSTSAGERFQQEATQRRVSNGRYHDRLGSDLLKQTPTLVAFIFSFCPATELFEESVTVRRFGKNISLFCCPWWTVCSSSCARQITYMACSSHTTPQTTSGWLCPDDHITAGLNRPPAKHLRFVWLVLLLHSDHLAGTRRDRTKKYDRIPSQARCSISVLRLWRVAAFRKSCQRLPFGLEPALNYWVHHA